MGQIPTNHVAYNDSRVRHILDRWGLMKPYAKDALIQSYELALQIQPWASLKSGWLSSIQVDGFWVDFFLTRQCFTVINIQWTGHSFDSYLDGQFIYSDGAREIKFDLATLDRPNCYGVPLPDHGTFSDALTALHRLDQEIEMFISSLKHYIRPRQVGYIDRRPATGTAQEGFTSPYRLYLQSAAGSRLYGDLNGGRHRYAVTPVLLEANSAPSRACRGKSDFTGHTHDAQRVRAFAANPRNMIIHGVQALLSEVPSTTRSSPQIPIANLAKPCHALTVSSRRLRANRNRSECDQSGSAACGGLPTDEAIGEADSSCFMLVVSKAKTHPMDIDAEGCRMHQLIQFVGLSIFDNDSLAPTLGVTRDAKLQGLTGIAKDFDRRDTTLAAFVTARLDRFFDPLGAWVDSLEESIWTVRELDSDDLESDLVDRRDWKFLTQPPVIRSEAVPETFIH